MSLPQQETMNSDVIFLSDDDDGDTAPAFPEDDMLEALQQSELQYQQDEYRALERNKRINDEEKALFLMADMVSHQDVQDQSGSQPAVAKVVLEDNVTFMHPANIRYSEECISPYFDSTPTTEAEQKRFGSRSRKRKQTCDKSDLLIEDLLKKLRAGTVKVEDVPRIRVVFLEDSKCCSLDNRRLWVFRHFGQPIPVQIMKEGAPVLKKLTGDGERVRLRDPDAPKECYDGKQLLCVKMLRWRVHDVMNQNLLDKKVRGGTPWKRFSLQSTLHGFMT